MKKTKRMTQRVKKSGKKRERMREKAKREKREGDKAKGIKKDEGLVHIDATVRPSGFFLCSELPGQVKECNHLHTRSCFWLVQSSHFSFFVVRK